MRLARYDEVAPTKAQRRAFSCGAPSLDRWLAMQARQSLESRDAVTYLLVDEDQHLARIAGYFCLSAGSVSRGAAPASVAKRAPEPVPVVLMGRFAIDVEYQGAGWAADLLREALLGAVSAGRLIGARALLVDAIDDTAVGFYERFGFVASPVHPRQMFKALEDVSVSAGLE